MTSLLDRLSTERQRRFVGRNPELQLFEQAIASAKLPFHVLHIFGPGGVGKTTLMRQFLHICEQQKIPTVYLESRVVEPQSEAFVAALRSIMGLGESESPLAKLESLNKRNVVFIDTYETIASLDEWLREEFLPQMGEQTLFVIAGRNSPTTPWRTDPGWQALQQALPLQNLNPEESLTYLARRDVPITQHQSILDFTHGHPLALSLVADVFAQGQDINFQAESAPDIVKTLLERFLEEVPTPAHRMALEACAVVRLTTEALLTQMLDVPNVHELFEWLRGLSCIESGQGGVFPHDLAREVLISDLRWRNSDIYTELHHRARAYYTTRLGQSLGQEKHRVLFDYIFLHRDNPAIRPSFTWGEHSSLLTDTLKGSDVPTILRMVEEYEGESSAQIAAYWLQLQPENVVIFRDSQAEPAGFAMMLALHNATPEELALDPGAIAAWNYLQKHAPLRPQEGATIFRFWMARDTYQTVSPTQSLIFINFVQYFQKTPGLAYTFLPCANADIWQPMLTYFDLTPLPEAGFSVGKKRYGVYGHDWRVTSPAAWQQLLAQREIAASVETTVATVSNNQPVLVLSQTEFIEAVGESLRNFTRHDSLQKNPLLRSRVVLEGVTDQGNMAERVATLQSLIKQAAESLQSSPKDEKLYRAVYRTYLNPAPTQEQAAELLDLPFSTYRRHLKAGITRITEILWQREIN
ncbi:ATP-binding protein [Calothrix sp. 336/3]|uniref:ATP-binding protein n=1 Tax=Calothrix sp. 336/3 TaxID=1337936 RepID=UPI000B262CAA|nr:ATP-binding protein [Calothrix sp. 336/3]